MGLNVTYWRNDRVAEGARLESAYTPKGYRGFESRFLRKVIPEDKRENVGRVYIFTLQGSPRPGSPSES